MKNKTSAIALGIVWTIALMASPGCSSQDASRTAPEPIGVRQSLLCGDGILDLDEECDDGANNSDPDPDACRTDCTKAHCGDGTVDFGESCDSIPGAQWCNNDSYMQWCIPNTCGNGYFVDNSYWGVFEACDDHNSEDGDTCRSDCGQDMTKCGNNVVDQGEQCDFGPTFNSNLPNKECRTNCQLARCGDGIVDDKANPPEQCDRSDGCGPDCKWL